jgi:hypothetical protein
MQGTGRKWLSLTPEPEVELPAAVATLRHGSAAPPDRIARERERFERLVARARRRAYRRWLAEARQLALDGDSSEDEDLHSAADLTLAVIDNHEALRSGLERRGRGGRGGRGR